VKQKMSWGGVRVLSGSQMTKRLALKCDRLENRSFSWISGPHTTKRRDVTGESSQKFGQDAEAKTEKKRMRLVN